MDNHDELLAECQRAESGLPEYGSASLVATWNARPFDRSRQDEAYLKWNDSIRTAFFGEYKPRVLRAIERHSRDDIDAACAAGSTWLVEVYRKAHNFGGSQHINSGEETVSCHIRTLAAKGHFGPEQVVIAMWLQLGEDIAEIYHDRIVSDRGRVLNRAEYALLSGQPPRSFTSPQVVEKLEMEALRDAEAAKHMPYESNFYTAADGTRLHLADTEGRKVHDNPESE